MSYGVALAWPYVWLMRFLCFFGTVPSQRSSFGFYNSVVFFLLASLACQPDVYKNAFTVKCFVQCEAHVERNGRPGSPAAVPRGSVILLLHLEFQFQSPTWINSQAWVR